ncbi:MAG: glycosyltransferase family 1 protein [Candidatus Microsaccharimonas sp.]
MKIRVEINSLASKHITGVGYYTKRLTEALIKDKQNTVSTFSFNFLTRQPVPKFKNRPTQEINRWFPLRVYAKLHSHRFTLPFDLFLKPVDLTIFTNYARWPTVKSRYTATTIHDLTFLHYPELVEEKNLAHLNRIVKRSIRSSDFIITVSEAVKSEIVEYFKISPDRIVTTPVLPDDTFYKKNDNEVHKKYGIPTNKYLFFISTIEPRKNIPVLIKAYEKLSPKLRKEYSLVLSGGMGWKGEASVKAIKTAQRKGLQVIHTGYIDEQDKSALYQQASAFVFPSIYEGFGMPLLEAAASQTPIVTTDIPVLKEAAGEGAAYFKSGDSKELASAITTVLTDTHRRADLVKKASAHLRTFSWADNAHKIIAKVKEYEDRDLNVHETS